jgi:undecaprenyl diphosphate synthase
MSNSQIPKHIGFIMDGNRRWAKQKGLSTLEGHTAGSKSLGKLIEECSKLGVETVTVYALSTENVEKRMKSEIKGIFQLLSNWITKKQSHLNDNGINLQFFGKLDQLPKSLQRKIEKITKVLKKNERIKLNVLLNYGGRAEIVESIKQIIKDGTSAADINEELVSKNLYTQGLPDPDLIIRTGGQKRISNFLIWQMSYSELYFTDTLWPDFDSKELEKALKDYSTRSRRFGGQNTIPLNAKKA